MDGHGVRELKCMEKCIGYYAGPSVSPCYFHKFADHFWAQDAPMLVRKLNCPRILGICRAGFYPHIKFS